MNTIKRFKNFISILMLYAANIITGDRPLYYTDVPRFDRRITGTVFPKLTTDQKI